MSVTLRATAPHPTGLPWTLPDPSPQINRSYLSMPIRSKSCPSGSPRIGGAWTPTTGIKRGSVAALAVAGHSGDRLETGFDGFGILLSSLSQFLESVGHLILDILPKFHGTKHYHRLNLLEVLQAAEDAGW